MRAAFVLALACIASVAGVEESQQPQASSLKLTPTVVRGMLFLPPASGVECGASSVLLDVAGRRVLDLSPGPNDVSRLSSGVYFVRGPRTEDRRPAGVWRVVVTK